MKHTMLVAAAIAVVSIMGCDRMKPEDFAGRGPEFRVESYFEGRTEAWGIFVDRFGNLRREFRVEIEGRTEGDTFVMVEDFAYADGETGRRTWHIRALGDGRYEGRADDVVGIASGIARGPALNWRYTLALPIGGRTWHVAFDDWMFLQPGGVVINRAKVSKFGIAIGTVTLFFRKPTDYE